MTESPEKQTRRSCDSAAGSGAMMQIIEALDRASLALSVSHNLTVTDRPIFRAISGRCGCSTIPLRWKP
jgi:hypothetical protein